MQLDAEEDGQAPLFKPPIVSPPEPTAEESRPKPPGEGAAEPATAVDVALEQDA